MGKKNYLSDLITEEEMGSMLEPNARTLIVAGVGSGKTTFIEMISKKISERDSKSTLAITSRAVKRLEMESDQRKSGSPIIVRTNSSANKVSLEDELQNIGCIVLDEAHSMVADSTFTDNAFLMELLFDELNEVPIIFMTATPGPLELNRWYENQNFKVLDFLNKDLVSVLPKKICIIDQEQADELVGTSKDKLFYYLDDTERLMRLYHKNPTESVVLLSGINMSEGNVTVRSGSKMDRLQERQKRKAINAYRNIILNNKITGKYKKYFTTSVFREGINILHANGLRVAVVETGNVEDMYQFAGRFRYGLDVLYVVPRKNYASERKIKEFEESVSAFIGLLDDGLPYYFVKIECERKDSCITRSLEDSRFRLKDDVLKYMRYNKETIERFLEDPLVVLSEHFPGVPVEIKVEDFSFLDDAKKDRFLKKDADAVIKSVLSEGGWLSKFEEKEALRALSNKGILKDDGEPYSSFGVLMRENGWFKKREVKNKRMDDYGGKMWGK